MWKKLFSTVTRKKKRSSSEPCHWLRGRWQESAMALETGTQAAIYVFQQTTPLLTTWAPAAPHTVDHLHGGTMSASVAVYRSIYTEDRFKQAYGSDDDTGGSLRLREKLAGRCRCSRRACLHLLRERLPIFSWLPRYRLKKWILGDTVAGLTVGILHIPQGELWYYDEVTENRSETRK